MMVDLTAKQCHLNVNKTKVGHATDVRDNVQLHISQSVNAYDDQIGNYDGDGVHVNIDHVRDYQGDVMVDVMFETYLGEPRFPFDPNQQQRPPDK